MARADALCKASCSLMVILFISMWLTPGWVYLVKEHNHIDAQVNSAWRAVSRDASRSKGSADRLDLSGVSGLLSASDRWNRVLQAEAF